MTMLKLGGSWVRDGKYEVGSYWEGWPAEGVITQVYGQMSVTGHPHSGVDIAAPYRSPMLAPIAGWARYYNYGDFGIHVIIQPDRDDEYGQLYVVMAHMDEAIGHDRQVVPGDKLGYVGFSGKIVPANINGTHVHFGFGMDSLISGDYRRCVDPYVFIQRAEEEDDMSSSARLGLQFIAASGIDRVAACYDVFVKNGLIDRLYGAGQQANPIDENNDLNDAIVMRFQILGIAASDIADEAFALVS